MSNVRGAHCHTDDYLLVAKVRKRLAVSKQAVKKTDMEKFNLNKLNEGRKVKSSIKLQSKTSLQFWKTYRIITK
jgi:hypothetical protein